MKEREDATKEKGEKEEKEGKAKTMKQVTPVEIHEYNTVNASCSTRLLPNQKKKKSDKDCIKEGKKRIIGK